MNRASLALAAALAVTLAVPASAWPCINPVTIATSAGARKLKWAERFLADGRPAFAEALTNPMFNRYPDELMPKATELWVIAELRRGRGYVINNPVALFTERRTANPGDPVIEARLAEAHAATGDTEQARTIIEDLAARDLIPDPFAYVTLADVRHRAGDEAGAQVALQRCKAMARPGLAFRVCRLHDAPKEV